MTKNELDALIAGQREKLKKAIVVRKGKFGDDSGLSKQDKAIFNIHKREQATGATLEFQKRADDLYLAATILGKDAKDLNLYKSLSEFITGDSELSKAMDTTSSGSGLEWIPTNFSSSLIDEVKLARVVAAIFPRVMMPTDPFKLPSKTAGSTARLISTENTAPVASNPTTGNIVLNAIKLMTYVPLSTEMTEDSVIAILPLVRSDIVESLVDAEENAILNGDDSGTHMDSDVTVATDQRKSWKGLRKYSIANSHVRSLATFNADNLALMKADMGKYGVDPKKLTWIFSAAGYAQLLTLKDSQNNAVLITMDKVGPQATIMTGQVGILFGSPVLVSQFIREDLNASGYYDATTATETVVHLVFNAGFVIGDRRAITVKQDEVIKTDSIDVVASVREAFMPRYDITSEAIVMTGIALTV